MSTKSKILAGLVALGVAGGVMMFLGPNDSSPSVELRELTRSQLELRDGEVLHVSGEQEPFDGTVVEYYQDMKKRIALEIRDGKPHGISRGWFENGQLEVEETFVKGVSDGKRIRWYENGAKKSEAVIVAGVIEGRFVRWYDNGELEAVVEMTGGKANGVSRGWYRSGQEKSRVVVEAGKVVSREFYEERKEEL